MPGLPRWLRAHLWAAVALLCLAAAWWQGGVAVGWWLGAWIWGR
ncbi:MAG: hypothetical protein ACO1SX_22235 [Actinomycetota bacterium]